MVGAKNTHTQQTHTHTGAHTQTQNIFSSDTQIKKKTKHTHMSLFCTIRISGKRFWLDRHSVIISHTWHPTTTQAARWTYHWCGSPVPLVLRWPYHHGVCTHTHTHNKHQTSVKTEIKEIHTRLFSHDPLETLPSPRQHTPFNVTLRFFSGFLTLSPSQHPREKKC